MKKLQQIPIWVTLMMTGIIMFICPGCAPTEPRLHQTGNYTIKTIAGDKVTFKEVKGIYKIPNDTLKVNDKIIINVVKLHP